MNKKRSARWHTIYSIISTVLEEAAIAILVVWILPLFGVNIPWWGLVLILVGFAVFSYIMYRVGHPTISFKDISSPESIIGSEGIVESELNPEGYVRVQGELWKAVSGGERLERGEPVTVMGMQGLKLTVQRKASAGPG